MIRYYPLILPKWGKNSHQKILNLKENCEFSPSPGGLSVKRGGIIISKKPYSGDHGIYSANNGT